MERIHGQSIRKALPALSDADREIIFTQLRDMIKELRAPPTTFRHRSSELRWRLLARLPHPRCQPRFGPFRTIQDFRKTFRLWLRENLRPEEHPNRQDDQDWNDINEMVADQDGPWPPPVFTHRDLNPFDILVNDNQVVSVID